MNNKNKKKAIIENLNKLEPWNSGVFPALINSIRYNQDYTLFTLATSKGYKIFSTENLKQVHEETQKVRDLGDLDIVMTYYRSNLVFFLAKENNPNFSQNELIIFDDYSQSKISHFRVKSEKIIDFFVSKNLIFVTLMKKVIILELLTMQIINIIEDINTANKLISYNIYDIIAFIKPNTKYKVFLKIFLSKKYKINSIFNKCVDTSFEWIQLLELSQSGQYIGLVSVLGNKIHVYYTQTSILKECIFLGSTIYSIEKLSFSRKKEKYILVNENDVKFVVYKLGDREYNFSECNCNKYKEDDLVNEHIKNEYGLFDYFWSFKNTDIKEPHAYFYIPKEIMLIDFSYNNNKSIFYINKRGYYSQLFFEKTKQNEIIPEITVQWA